jgi:hypothetical protein
MNKREDVTSKYEESNIPQQLPRIQKLRENPYR